MVRWQARAKLEGDQDGAMARRGGNPHSDFKIATSGVKALSVYQHDLRSYAEGIFWSVQRNNQRASAFGRLFVARLPMSHRWRSTPVTISTWQRS